jgi:hypothetical protein
MATSTPLTISAGFKQLLQPGGRLANSLFINSNGMLQRLPTTAGLDTSPLYSGSPNWPATRSALSLCNATSPFAASNAIGSIATAAANWSGAVLAPNGLIYCVPNGATGVLVINPATNAILNTISLSPITGSWSGGVLASNGNIYCVPYSASTVLVITPSSVSPYGTLSTIGSGLSGSTYWGGVLAGGYIYCSPSGATSILIINPAGGTVSTSGTVSASSHWTGAVLAPNGKIYCLPDGSGSVLVITPSGTTVTTATISTATTSSCFGGVLAPNGMIYAIPYTTASGAVLMINPNNGTITTISSGQTFSSSFRGGFVTPSGMIYAFPYAALGMLAIDSTTNAVSLVGTFPSGNKCSGGVLAPNGIAYGVPGGNSDFVETFNTGFSDIPLNLCLSPYFNKL